MREQTTRLVAFVLLLLIVAFAGIGRDIDAHAATQLRQSVKVYFPIVHIRPVEASRDLHIVHLGLYQSAQNDSNSVTLIARKPAMLRVYAQVDKISGSSPQVRVTVEAFRDGRSLGTLTSALKTVSFEPTADNLDSTFNFQIPVDWLRGEVTLTASVDQSNELVETNEDNNSRSNTFTFREVPPLNLTIVPIRYVDTQTGITFYKPAHDPITDWIFSAYPLSEIKVTYREPMTFTGNLRKNEDWSRLLGDLTMLWAAEAGYGSAHAYYGLIPNFSPGGMSWFAGGVSGLGWIGQRVAVGMDLGSASGELAGHELGHNFGRKHAPCGNPSGVDINFPYPNASIGVYAVDTDESILFTPNHTHDMMSYCGPEWVSDYTYEGLLDDHLLRSGREGLKGEGLLLRAVVDGDQVTALPVFRLDQPILPDENAGKYQVQLLGEDGQVIGSYPAALLEAEEEDVSARMLIAYIPAPSRGEIITAVRFLDGTELLTERKMDGSPYHPGLKYQKPVK